MGKKRTDLTVTPADIEQRPERLRRTPSGGWAWKCGLCGRYASSLTVKGEPRCYHHGGTALRKRDLARVHEDRLKGKSVRPSGRPLKNGFYSRDERVNIQQLVDEYHVQGDDPDATELDMLHLRARIENALQLEPSAEEVRTTLDTLLDELHTFAALPVEGESLTVDGVLNVLGTLDRLTRYIREADRLLGKLLTFERAIKNDHERVIKLAKTRAETRKANAAAAQLDAFAILVRNFLTVLKEMLPPEIYQALPVRIRKDFESISKRALEPGTVKRDLNCWPSLTTSCGRHPGHDQMPGLLKPSPIFTPEAPWPGLEVYYQAPTHLGL
jgi:hypothetical protein